MGVSDPDIGAIERSCAGVVPHRKDAKRCAISGVQFRNAPVHLQVVALIHHPNVGPIKNHTIGRARTATVRTTTPSEARNSVTLLSSLFATHRLAPSKAMPLGALPIAKDLVGGVKLRCWWATAAEFVPVHWDGLSSAHLAATHGE